MDIGNTRIYQGREALTVLGADEIDACPLCADEDSFGEPCGACLRSGSDDEQLYPAWMEADPLTGHAPGRYDA